MDREQFIEALWLAEGFVSQNDDELLYTGSSLGEILRRLRKDFMEITPEQETATLTMWSKNAFLLHERMRNSAETPGRPLAQFDGRQMLVVRRSDIKEAFLKCPKGPDYPYPGER